LPQLLYPKKWVTARNLDFKISDRNHHFVIHKKKKSIKFYLKRIKISLMEWWLRRNLQAEGSPG